MTFLALSAGSALLSLLAVIDLLGGAVGERNQETIAVFLNVRDYIALVDESLELLDLRIQAGDVVRELVNLLAVIFGTSGQKCSTCEDAHDCHSKDFSHTLSN